MEEIKMSTKTSFVNQAYAVLVKAEKELNFYTLWEEVCRELEISEEDYKARMSYFYTQLTLDGRFVTLGENVWDLRTRHTFDKVHIDMNDVYAEVEQEEKQAEWEAEEDDELDEADKSEDEDADVDSYNDDDDDTGDEEY